MFMRSLFILAIVFMCCSTSALCADNQVGQTVVCDQPSCQPTVVQAQPQAKTAFFATWWANSSLGHFYYSFCRDTKRNNYWPKPFVKADRLAVRQPFLTMVNNGWRRQNTLGTQHFEPETGKLNRSGQLKIRSILLQGLPQHRDLYVYRTERPGETAKRVEAVQQYAAMTVRGGNMPPIYETDLPAIATPAQRVDIIDQKYQASMPDPRLPSEQQSDDEQ